MIACDTNLLVRIASEDDPDHETALAARDALLRRGEPLCIFPQVVYEFFVVSTRTSKANGLGFESTAAETFIVGFLEEMRLVPDSEKTFEAWRDLTGRYGVRGNPNHDLRIVAAMIASGVSRVMSFNAKHFRRFTEIEVIDPKRL